MHCGLSRVKNTIYKPLSSEENTVQKKYCDERFLSYNGNMSINFLSIYAISLHVWRNEFSNDKFHSDFFIFLGSSLFY